jgi:hypothetical protein
MGLTIARWERQVERSGRQDAGILNYPKHQLAPEDLLNFCELRGFVDEWEELGLDVEFDLLALQVGIMAHPKAGVVVPGTGGLRKLEFSPPRGRGGKKRGKRNSCRVCYVYFEEFHTVLLVTAYAKGRKDDLKSHEKKAIKKAIERNHEELSNRYRKKR